MTSTKQGHVETEADTEIMDCLDSNRSFSVVAGAGSGKTTSLIKALGHLREGKGQALRRDDKQIACITYTNRAVDVISERLGWDELFHVSTLHSFLWNEVKRFTPNIRIALHKEIIPEYIGKKKTEDNGGDSQKAVKARSRVKDLTCDLEKIDTVNRFIYNDNQFSDYQEGKIGHDDVIAISVQLMTKHKSLQKIIGQKYPYIFVDEAQDTFSNVVEALNKLCINEGGPVVGYFGDQMQKIYEKGTGAFAGPKGSASITKEENFRCAPEIITVLNAFRTDVKQYAAGENAKAKGSVEVRLIKAECPEGTRKRYSDKQLLRASERFEETLNYWGWAGRKDVKSLFLVRQMIALRLGFPDFQKLFTGKYASIKAQDNYASGEHSLLKPFVRSIWPLVNAYKKGDMPSVIGILCNSSPAFDPEGRNANCPLGKMKELAMKLVKELAERWESETIRQILVFCHDNALCIIPDKVIEYLDRKPITMEYDNALHSSEKADWLADDFFKMTTLEISCYSNFINDNTPYSTQHGVKGEEYKDVVVVFDDIEAGWNKYSFTKMLTPNTSGKATDGQSDKSTKLAYVCFSRAKENLRIMLFTPDPEAAKKELISKSLFSDKQITIARPQQVQPNKSA